MSVLLHGPEVQRTDIRPSLDKHEDIEEEDRGEKTFTFSKT